MTRGIRRRLELVGRAVRREAFTVDVLFCQRDLVSHEYVGPALDGSYRLVYHPDGSMTRRPLTPDERREVRV